MPIFGNPARKAQPYLEQIPSATQPYYQPYIDQGQQAGGQAANVYSQMSQDPTAYLNQLLSSYTPSKGFQFQQEQALKAARNSAASGGFAGTQYDQMRQADLANSLASQDMYKWLENAMGAQQLGLGGQDRMAQRGYEASRGYGDILGSSLDQQANLAYRGQTDKNRMLADLWGQALGAGAKYADRYWGER